ncbi:MAG: SMI1/KNR4 family protein [Verrucomicrobiota bacterium]
MHDWHKIIAKHHLLFHGKDAFLPRQGKPMKKTHLREIEKDLGFEFPEDVFSFYLQMNGYGLEHCEKEISTWFVIPADQIADVKAELADEMEMHPELAKDFIPVIDWDNGDYEGFIKGEPKTLFSFEHEFYDFDAEQPVDEFLEPTEETFFEFISHTPEG